MTTRYVKPKKFEEMTGYTVSAIEGKIATHQWREGHEYRKAPDGRILVDLEGYEAWVEHRQRAG